MEACGKVLFKALIKKIIKKMTGSSIETTDEDIHLIKVNFSRTEMCTLIAKKI